MGKLYLLHFGHSSSSLFPLNRLTVSSSLSLAGTSASPSPPPQIISQLLCAGANPNTMSPSRRSALHVCCSGGKNAFIPLLCRAGAHTEMRDEGGYTPLLLAVEVMRDVWGLTGRMMMRTQCVT